METRTIPFPALGRFRNGQAELELRGERRLSEVEALPRHRREQRVDPLGGDLDVVVEEERRLDNA